MLGEMSRPSSSTRHRGRRRLLAGTGLVLVIGVTWAILDARSRSAPGTPSPLDARRERVTGQLRERVAAIQPAVRMHSSVDSSGDWAGRFWARRHQLERIDDRPGTSLWFVLAGPASVEEVILTLEGDGMPEVEEKLLLDGHPVDAKVQGRTIRAVLGPRSLRSGLNHLWFSSVRKITVRVEERRVAAEPVSGASPVLPASWLAILPQPDAEERARELIRQYPDHPLASLPLLEVLTRSVRAGTGEDTIEDAMDAMDILQDLLEDPTRSPTPWLSLASLLDLAGEPGMAWSCRLQACAASPGDLDTTEKLLEENRRSPGGTP